MNVKLIEILDAMNYTGIGAQFLYHTKTEEIVMLGDKVFGLARNEALEKDLRKHPDDYIDLPNEYEIDEVGMMDTYIENFPESDLKDELSETLVGRSPLSRFEEKMKENGFGTPATDSEICYKAKTIEEVASHFPEKLVESITNAMSTNNHERLFTSFFETSVIPTQIVNAGPTEENHNKIEVQV